ncbi:hypothetical protein KKA49_01960 [Patescibacteria group bacterium]|nr:hypothetical protein [Patescibacteria group bacterium]MBU1457086.1 hypothetical protein [Patescibacteria group bacterium]
MTLLEVEKTIKYSSFFGASLTLKELHLWLISPHIHSFMEVSNFISKHPALQKQLISKHDQKKTRLTKQKTKSIQKLISVLKCIPSIQLIALTGSLSIGNPKKYDDIDLMIITSPNTLWLTRPFVILLTSFLSKRRKPGEPLGLNNQVCINLWLDQTSLIVPKSKQNLYTAHEVLQTKPLFDRGGVHQQFIRVNSWTRKHLAAAHERKSPPGLCCACGEPRGWLKQTLNLLFFTSQYLYMKPKITNEYITPHSAYFHPRNLYPQIKTILQN